MEIHPRFDDYFDYKEFDSPDFKGSGATKMNKDFLYRLTEARMFANIPFRVTSGYRTAKHNKRVGGELNSGHTRGYACDIVAATSAERFIMISAFLKAGFNRIGVGRYYVHVDSDPNLPVNVIWDYYDK